MWNLTVLKRSSYGMTRKQQVQRKRQKRRHRKQRKHRRAGKRARRERQRARLRAPGRQKLSFMGKPGLMRKNQEAKTKPKPPAGKLRQAESMRSALMQRIS